MTSFLHTLYITVFYKSTFFRFNVQKFIFLQSCLVYTDNGDDFDGKLRVELQQPFNQLQNIAKSVGEIMFEAGDLDGTEEDAVENFVKQFRPDMMEIVYEWVSKINKRESSEQM